MKVQHKKNGFPDQKTLKRVRDRLSRPDYEGGSLAIPANATRSDVAKYEICQLIARYRREHGLKQKELAHLMGVDESRVSDVLHGKIESFTLDRLVGYAERIFPSFRIKILAA